MRIYGKCRTLRQAADFEQMPEVLLHIPLRQKNIKNTDHFIVMDIFKHFVHIMVMM